MVPWALHLMGSSARWVQSRQDSCWEQHQCFRLRCTTLADRFCSYTESWGLMQKDRQEKISDRSSWTGTFSTEILSLINAGPQQYKVKDVSLVEPKVMSVCSSSYFMAYPCQTSNSSIFGKILNFWKCFISFVFCFYLKKHVYFSAWVINRKRTCGLISEVRKVRNLCNGNEIVFGKVVVPSHHSGLWYLYPILGHKERLGCFASRKTRQKSIIILFSLITQKCASHGMRTLTCLLSQDDYLPNSIAHLTFKHKTWCWFPVINWLSQLCPKFQLMSFQVNSWNHKQNIMPLTVKWIMLLFNHLI